jgi:hypothetical protein
MAPVAPSILPAYIIDHGVRPFVLPFQGCDQRIFRLDIYALMLCANA